jgi:transcriptional regulator with XRE-family HTH domain
MMTTALTNPQFAKRVGIHFTMASRLRNGERLPSLPTFIRVMQEFELPAEKVKEWLDAISQGEEASGKWLRDNIFGS